MSILLNTLYAVWLAQKCLFQPLNITALYFFQWIKWCIVFLSLSVCEKYKCFSTNIPVTPVLSDKVYSLITSSRNILYIFHVNL